MVELGLRRALELGDDALGEHLAQLDPPLIERVDVPDGALGEYAVLVERDELSALLDKANAKRIFGTKMRSFVKQANGAGIKDIVAQQFEVARQIIAAGLVPIVEPEVDIHCLEKAKAEELLKAAILEALNRLPAGQPVMLKLTLPEKDNLYADFVGHPKVVRVVALSGGYSREEGNERLRRNHGVVASFSRALVEGLSAQQSDAEYNALLDASIQSIFEASNT